MSDESTAVATRDALGELPPAYKAALAFRRQEAMVAAELGKLNWGSKIDLVTRRAVAAWGRSNDVDPTTEIDVLGNRIYLNSRYFYRKMAQMIGEGAIDYAFADHVHEDERLVELAASGDQWAKEEKARRLQERIRHNVPEKAAAAVVFRVKAKSMTAEVTGVKWAGGGTQKNDPVGDSKPVESAESRAMRRAMLKLAEATKSTVAQEIVATIQSVEVIEPKVANAIEDFDANPDNEFKGIAALPPDGTVPDEATA